MSYQVYVGEKAGGKPFFFGEETHGYGLREQGINLLATLHFDKPEGAPLEAFALHDVDKFGEWVHMRLPPEYIGAAKEALISWLT
jgi:hypothetical protein